MAGYQSIHSGQEIDSAVTEVKNTSNSVTARKSGTGAPTSSTVGRVGDLYTDTATGKMYHCTSASGGVYGWEKVGAGDEGIYYTPSVSADGVVSWTNNGGLPNPAAVNVSGEDGVSPAASVERISGGVRITVTDGSGATSATLNDGTSPSASVEQTEDGAEITVTDASGTTTANLKNGYRIGSVYLKSGSTASGQTAVYGLRLNDTAQTEVGTISVYNGTDGQGTGDMTKSVYDTNNNGVVDTAENAQKLGGKAPSHYATAASVPNVPAWALNANKPTYTATEVGADASGSAAAVQTNLDTVTAIIPSQATSSNQLADKNFVNSSIENVAAYFITKDAAGNPFATKAELIAATTFYSGGVARTPTRNDYTAVLADESKTVTATGENPTTRYIYNNGWEYQYTVNNSGLTAAQWAAVNSNITDSKVMAYDAHIANNNIHVTAAQKTTWDAKQNAPVSATTFPSSGTALTDNTVYTISTNVGAFQFVAPADGGWAHGTFTKGSSGSITFGSGAAFVGGSAPTFTSGKKYEFDVLDGVWAFAEVGA